jgi:hypothetical protein
MHRQAERSKNIELYHELRFRVARGLREYVNSQQYVHVVVGLQRPTMQFGVAHLRHISVTSIMRIEKLLEESDV